MSSASTPPAVVTPTPSTTQSLAETPRRSPRLITLYQDPVGEVTPPPAKKAKRSAVASNASTPKTKGSQTRKSTSKSTPTKAKKPSKGSSKRSPTEARDPPKNWEEIYSLVEELRSDRSAPVDDNGSEALPQRDRGEVIFRFQVLICLMLSSQTKDAVVGETVRALQKHGCDVDTIANTSASDLNALIRKVGFHNNKTKYIKEAVSILQSEYNGDIPPNAELLQKLPGVGPKMAYIIEHVAWPDKEQSGLGVDTHMHRIFNELKWVSSKNPEQTRIQLESWLPRDKWPEVNLLWVGFGQEVQQFKPKLLKKCLECSRPAEALRLVKRLGLDYKKEGQKLGLEEEIQKALTK